MRLIQLIRQQIVTHCNSRYVLVALRLTGLVGLAETQKNYYSNNLMGGNPTLAARYHGQTKLCQNLPASACIDL